MTQIHWIKAASDTFGNASDWSGGRVPGAGDDAILDAPGSTPYTVSALTNATVNSVQTASTALLDIKVAFSATDGTGTGANLGAIRIENGAALTLQGPVVNVGTIELFGTVSPTSIVIGPSVTLSGGGAIFLNFTGGPDQRIVAATGGGILTDVDNRISGQGFLGGPGMTIVNQARGFIEAKGGPLVIDTGANTIVNAGLIDAEGAPGDDGLPPAQGTIQSPVDNSGILEIDGIGASLTVNGAVTGSGGAIIAGGNLRFNAAFSQNVHFETAGGALYLTRSATYGGVISQFAQIAGQSLDLGDIGFVGAGEATYNGTSSGGVLTVTDGTHTAHITLVGDYLNWAFVASGDGHGGTTVMAEARAVHWLSPVSGSFATAADWTAGTVPGPNNDAILDAAGSTKYTVTASASQSVASVQTAATATLDIASAFTAANGTGSGANAGEILVANNAAFTVGGVLNNARYVVLDATTGTARLVVAGAVTLAGGGEIFLGENSNDLLVGASTSVTLANIDNIIAGGGDLGGGKLILVNGAKGQIQSEGATVLTIDSGANAVVNAGLIESTGAGAIVQSAVNNTGVLKADGGNLTVNGAVTGSGGVIVAGGTLRFNASFNQNVAFSGSSAGVLALAQSQAYSATISGFSTTGTEALDLADIGFVSAGEASFSGMTSSGILTVTDGTHAAHIHLTGNYTSGDFTAASDGHGGTTIKDGPSAIHWLNPVSAAFTTAVDWTDGLVPGANNDAILDAPGSTKYIVTASTSQTVKSIQTAATATLDVAGAFTAAAGTGSGANVGTVLIANGGTFTIGGAFADPGRVIIDASNARTSFVAAANATLTGGGEVFIAENANDILIGASASVTLTNVDNIIAGGGGLGGGKLILVNGAKGQIQSEGAAPLIIDTGANTIVNAGLIEAAGAGATIMSAVANTGYLKADGGDLTVNGAVSGMGLGIVAGGTLRFNASFNQEVAFQGSSAGVLTLAQSSNYTALIAGLSAAGAESLDLADIGFVNSGEASYSGTTSSGVLTVTDGVHSAHIHFEGDYLGAAFTAASDGQGGTIIHATAPPAASVHRFIAAAARLGAGAAGPMGGGLESWRAAPAMLTRPALPE
ncbi:MAG: hypothetical protein M3T55_01870 [Pseudomonadota bacterium]|nr:hypothetical protein [Pseudomonadota bacterium]